jgi:hypothetical protein
MVSKSRNKISPEIKSQVLSELQVPGCIVSNLAKSYNVSNTTNIYLATESTKD